MYIWNVLHWKLERFFGSRDENCKGFLWELNPKWFCQKGLVEDRLRFPRPFIKPNSGHWSLFNHPEKVRFSDVFRLKWVNPHVLQSYVSYTENVYGGNKLPIFYHIRLCLSVSRDVHKYHFQKLNNWRGTGTCMRAFYNTIFLYWNISYKTVCTIFKPCIIR